MSLFRGHYNIPLIHRDASGLFLDKLTGVRRDDAEPGGLGGADNGDRFRLRRAYLRAGRMREMVISSSSDPSGAIRKLLHDSGLLSILTAFDRAGCS